MNTKQDNGRQDNSTRDFLIAAFVFLGIAAAILVPLYLVFPPVPS